MSKGYAKRYFFGIGQSDRSIGFRMVYSTPWPEWARWEYWRGFHTSPVGHVGPNEFSYGHTLIKKPVPQRVNEPAPDRGVDHG